MTKKPVHQDPTSAWRWLQNFLNRLGIYPLVALAGIVLLLIVPRLFLFAAIIYALCWLYRNRGFSGTQQNVFSRKSGRGKGKGRRR